eukprot:11481456-Heterocapsa_arctica.AAC.1
MPLVIPRGGAHLQTRTPDAGKRRRSQGRKKRPNSSRFYSRSGHKLQKAGLGQGKSSRHIVVTELLAQPTRDEEPK